ncbi:VOC family protein [Mycolicibacterium cosmeticum]|uniref:VOC family protein n=1 Tax=Mycolicibacterium cosmeticum TaxID=258533 RepID=UPI003204DCC1
MTGSIPTATNVDHVSWSVEDLDAAVSFCVEVLGGQEIFRAGPFADPSGDWMSTHFDVDARASAVLAYVRLGATQVVEFIQWSTANRRQEWPRNSDVGATHLAVHVRDIDQAMRYLQDHGCSACGSPILLDGVPHAGVTILYVRTPIGLLLELVSRPAHDLPYEATTEARLLAPTHEWSNGQATPRKEMP